MKKISIVLLAILLGSVIYKISSTSRARSSEKEPSDMVIHEAGECYTLDDNFTFCIPVKSFSSQGMLHELQGMNELMAFMHILMADSIQGLSSVNVSVYTNHEPLPMDSAFINTLSKRNSEDKDADYKLISSRKYMIDGLTLYQKISIRGGDYCAILYYFMENNFSNTVYEIKVGGSPSEINKLKALAEKIALSVYFQNENELENKDYSGASMALSVD